MLKSETLLTRYKKLKIIFSFSFSHKRLSKKRKLKKMSQEEEKNMKSYIENESNGFR